jgi:hypothetical protein
MAWQKRSGLPALVFLLKFVAIAPASASQYVVEGFSLGVYCWSTMPELMADREAHREERMRSIR